MAGAEPKAYARLNTTTAIASTIATRRSYTLRAGVLSLGVGLVFIVLPSVSFGSSTAPAAASTQVSPAWPTPNSGIPDALNAIVYKAQVDEVAEARKAATRAAMSAPVDDTTALVGLGLLGLVVTFGLPAFWKTERELPSALKL